jgi:hypothetical protein
MKLDIIRIWPEGSPRAFLIDRVFARKIRKVRWHFLPKGNRVRGFFGRTATRQYLHRYVLTLARLHFPEVTFANGDWWDCRLVNLKPYDREEDGAKRSLFKNSTSKLKGVSYHKRLKKWVAMIRVKSKLHHLGYFKRPREAAAAYAKAWNDSHPNLTPIPIPGRI